MSNTTTIEAPRLYPTFRYRDANRMIDWLVEAFGFEVHALYRDDEGNVAHSQLAFGSAMIMIGHSREDDYGRMVGGPGENGGKGIYVAVPDTDQACARARAAGAEILEEPTDRDYGNREFLCRDPEGNVWAFGTYWPKAHEEALAAE
ncbi:MAG: VOC family protein [Azospirillaceae bacterium]